MPSAYSSNQNGRASSTAGNAGATNVATTAAAVTTTAARSRLRGGGVNAAVNRYRKYGYSTISTTSTLVASRPTTPPGSSGRKSPATITAPRVPKVAVS